MNDKLKDAICNQNLLFLEENKDKYNIDFRFEDENGDTLLMYALSDSHTNTYKYFLNNHADISLVNYEGENIIHSIIYSGNIERLTEVVEQTNFNLDLQTNDGITPIMLSLLLGNLEIFEFLLHKGVDINLADKENNLPIHVACQLGYYEAVKMLVMHGTLLNIKTKKGNYPLALAINGSYHEIVKYLYEQIYG